MITVEVDALQVTIKRFQQEDTRNHPAAERVRICGPAHLKATFKKNFYVYNMIYD